MYIGKLGDGSSFDDGIYILLKEVLDNCIDEFVMGHGKKVEVTIEGPRVEVRDYGRGVPLGKVVDVVSKINTGAKYDSKAFKKSVGLNGVGTKAVNALSSYFKIESVPRGPDEARGVRHRRAAQGREAGDHHRAQRHPRGLRAGRADLRAATSTATSTSSGCCGTTATSTRASPSTTTARSSRARTACWTCWQTKMDGEPLYPIIHLVGDDIEVAITHANHYGEEYYSFVNGQHTTQGGTHQGAFREAVAKTIKDYFKKDWEAADVPHGHRGGREREGDRTGVREPDQDQARQPRRSSPEGRACAASSATSSAASSTTSCTRTPRWPRCSRRASWRTSASGRSSAASASWPASAPRKPACTTASCATAASTSATPRRTTARRTARSSSPRATAPAAASPRAAT